MLSVAGEVYGVPYMAMANVLIYLKDLLDRYGLPVPQTWEELRRVALAGSDDCHISGR